MTPSSPSDADIISGSPLGQIVRMEIRHVWDMCTEKRRLHIFQRGNSNICLCFMIFYDIGYCRQFMC